MSRERCGGAAPIADAGGLPPVRIPVDHLVVHAASRASATGHPPEAVSRHQLAIVRERVAVARATAADRP